MWTNKDVDKYREALAERHRREVCYTSQPVCPACKTKVTTTAVDLIKSHSTDLREDEDFTDFKCSECREELIIQIHIPLPTYSTYVRKHLEKDDA